MSPPGVAQDAMGLSSVTETLNPFKNLKKSHHWDAGCICIAHEPARRRPGRVNVLHAC